MTEKVKGIGEIGVFDEEDVEEGGIKCIHHFIGQPALDQDEIFERTKVERGHESYAERAL